MKNSPASQGIFIRLLHTLREIPLLGLFFKPLIDLFGTQEQSQKAKKNIQFEEETTPETKEESQKAKKTIKFEEEETLETKKESSPTQYKVVAASTQRYEDGFRRGQVSSSIYEIDEIIGDSGETGSYSSPKKSVTLKDNKPSSDGKEWRNQNNVVQESPNPKIIAPSSPGRSHTTSNQI